MSSKPDENWFYWEKNIVPFQKAIKIINLNNKNYFSYHKHFYKKNFDYIFHGKNNVDIGWYKANIETRNKMMDDIYNLFYKLQENGFKTSCIARACLYYSELSTFQSWINFINVNMWQNKSGKLQLFRIPYKHLYFIDIAKHILKYIGEQNEVNKS